MILTIYLENGIRSVYQRAPLVDKVVTNFESVDEAITSYYGSVHTECVIHTDSLEEQGSSYLVKRTFEGRFFNLYAWQHGKGWIPRLNHVQWSVIKNFFGAEIL